MKKRILILDDKETIAKVLSIYLMAEYDCIWLQDGVQGMKWLQEGNLPDLIISDIRMPEMRGDDFLEWIKVQAHSRHYAEQRRQHHRTNKTTRNRCGRLYRKAL